LVCGEAGHDADSDRICSATDNCPRHANAEQEDYDSDSIGNICDCN
jgi:hypothetical protein